MEFIIIGLLVLIGIIGFIYTSVKASKKYLIGEPLNTSEYMYVWLFAAVAAFGMLYLIISRL